MRNATPNKYPAYHEVTMYPAWDENFFEFAEYIDEHWDLKDLTSEDIFDRIDNSKPYEPGNVRFTDRKGNARDRRTTHYFTYNGRTQSVAAWAEETGIEFSCLLSRIEKGWKPRDVITKGYYGKT
jgi:hypothetical protein